MELENRDKVNIAMVGYYNTLPFLFGLQDNNKFNLILDVPSKCIDYFDDQSVDIALVPVATLLDRSDYKIVTDYCIGCDGAVRTVSLFSNNPLQEIGKIYLDKDSRTSQKLVKILCERHWQIDPVFQEVHMSKISPENLNQNEAVLMIGDKVFKNENTFVHNFDLGTEWKNMTNLPFTFAVWIGRENVDNELVNELNNALSLGVGNIGLVLERNHALATKIDLSEYFKEYIEFNFDLAKKEALNLFFSINEKAIPITE